MSFVAIINVPGYLPETEPVPFDTAAQAWEYLMSQVERSYWGLDDAPGAQQLAVEADIRNAVDQGEGTVYAPTPGYQGDHDLGLVYEVQAVSA